MKQYFYTGIPVRVQSTRDKNVVLITDDVGNEHLVAKKDLVVRSIYSQEKAAKRKQRNFGVDERIAIINAMPCCVNGCTRSPSVNMHTRSRGAGGTYRDIIPACQMHHDESHRVGIKTFADKYKLDLPALAASIAAKVDEILDISK